MARSETLPIYLKTYRLLVEIYRVTAGFPREMKFSLGQDMRHDAMEMFRAIFRANRHADKRADLEHFLSTFEMVKLQLRLSRELNVLSVRKLAHLALMMEEISRQAVAWKNYHAKRTDKKTVAPEKKTDRPGPELFVAAPVANAFKTVNPVAEFFEAENSDPENPLGFSGAQNPEATPEAQNPEAAPEAQNPAAANPAATPEAQNPAAAPDKEKGGKTQNGQMI